MTVRKPVILAAIWLAFLALSLSTSWAWIILALLSAAAGVGELKAAHKAAHKTFDKFAY